MTQDSRKLCLNCAWREHCAKRFSMEGCTTLHCPDYSEDMTLRKALAAENHALAEED
ncbi:MAG: hypothetical protein ACWGOL_04190 [Desulfuromonadales bacterium]